MKEKKKLIASLPNGFQDSWESSLFLKKKINSKFTQWFSG